MSGKPKKPEPFIAQPDIPADAVAEQVKEQASPGYNAGNPLLDRFYETLKIEGIKDKFKKLYETLNPKK